MSALIDRGNLFRQARSVEDAIQDFDKAIAIGSDREPVGAGDGQFYRAVARCVQEDWVEAKGDLEAASHVGVLVASSFQGICGSIPSFEAEYDIRLPSVVATMLHVA